MVIPASPGELDLQEPFQLQYIK